MDYDEALDWMMSFWEVGRTKVEERALRPLKVPRMRALLERLGSPHRRYPSVLVAGTKGKGSTVAFISEGLRAAGYRVGRYTQPHLVDWCERTWVDGKIIAPGEVAELAARIRPAVEGLHQGMKDLSALTTYEVGTAVALCHFADEAVDVAVLEIGVGGRLDALNVVEPVASAITSLSLDHTDVLGGTLAEIATEKAGILRPGRPAVSAPQRPEAEEAILRAAEEVGADLYLVGRDWRWAVGETPELFDISGPRGVLKGLAVPLLGDHQRDNATVAVAILQLLGERGFRVEDGAIRRGLAGVEWPGRVQLLSRSPLVVVDAAHNEDSARRLVQTVRSSFQYDRLILVFGASAGKDLAGMAEQLCPAAGRVLLTSSGHRRAADEETLVAAFSFSPEVRFKDDPEAAIRQAVAEAGPGDLVLITGSVFLAGRAIQLFGSSGDPADSPVS